MDFVNRILCSHLNWMVYMLYIRNKFSATLKFIEPIFDGSHRSYMVLINGTLLRLDFLAGFSIQQENQNHFLILLFFHGFIKKQTCLLSTAVKTEMFNKFALNYFLSNKTDLSYNILKLEEIPIQLSNFLYCE